jgi:hypothetical protein
VQCETSTSACWIYALGSHFAGEDPSDVTRIGRWYERFAPAFQRFDAQALIIPRTTRLPADDTLEDSWARHRRHAGRSRTPIVPQTGSYRDTDHVLSHEIVLLRVPAQSRRVAGCRPNHPRMAVEEWPSHIDRASTHHHVGCAARVPWNFLSDLASDNFPYRFDQRVGVHQRTWRRRRRAGSAAIRIGSAGRKQVLGVDHDSLSAQWKRGRQQYRR